MKIRRSLKIFIVCAIMGMATITVVGFSTLTANYFEKGLDGGVRMTMQEIGRFSPANSDKEEYTLGFQIVHQWQEVTPEIRQVFAQPTKHLEFYKKIYRDHWYSEPNGALFLLRYERSNNEVLYISRIVDDIEAADLSSRLNQDDLPHLCQILGYATIALAMFAVCMYFVMQLVAQPIERLAKWAKTLTPCQLNHPLPDFHYNELNRLATIVKNSLSSVEDSLRREHKFLAHASHELRTPIAVVRSNTELMTKLVDKPNSIEKQKEVLERILRAGVTMTDLCETLLWLNRGHHNQLPLSQLHLGELLKQLSQELNYLIRDKDVQVEITVEGGVFELPTTLCRIVLSNLIRNAYQHTLRGTVVITQLGAEVSIKNRDTSCGDTQEQLGFGLGLELTHRIIRHYSWDCTIEEYPDGRDVRINFTS
ncbi:sensor histidine kinase [Vibrio ziniensis]|uniref:histidine kinase n=1 Tax=Vibrio ziniensis TaxID=2711221 RepID=A0A6G7CJA8_9VIBR|nr:HAMP domain-containing sensor histidine kinase [Vibrio ziniensis]QIH42195.1 HAMP domain-containing histidine kinase [Vibrio ziniensis]